MKIQEHCTYWTVRWTKRIDAVGRRYTGIKPVYISGHERDAIAMWESMGFEKVSDRTWVNGDASTEITRQADKEIEYEIHASPRVA